MRHEIIISREVEQILSRGVATWDEAMAAARDQLAASASGHFGRSWSTFYKLRVYKDPALAPHPWRLRWVLQEPIASALRGEP